MKYGAYRAEMTCVLCGADRPVAPEHCPSGSNGNHHFKPVLMPLLPEKPRPKRRDIYNTLFWLLVMGVIYILFVGVGSTGWVPTFGGNMLGWVPTWVLLAVIIVLGSVIAILLSALKEHLDYEHGNRPPML